MAIKRADLVERMAALTAALHGGGPTEKRYLDENGALIWQIRNPIKSTIRIWPYFAHPSHESRERIVIERWNTEKNGWEPFDHDTGLPLLDWAQTCPVVAQITRFIPTEVRHIGLSIRYLQISMINACLEHAAFKQLCQTDFNLAWLFLGCAQKRQLTPVQLAHWLTRPRIDLLEFITGQRQKSILKWLRKVTADVGDETDWQRLFRWVVDPAVVAYLSGFGTASITFLQTLRLADLAVDIRGWHEEITLLKSLTANECPSKLRGLKHWLDDVRRLGNALGIPPESHFSGLRSIQGVKRRHDKWVERLNKRLAAQNEDYNLPISSFYPKPPIEATERIQPILTRRALQNEGREMQHCVASYHDSVADGNCYIYRFLGEQRATIELKRFDGIWYLGQILGKENSPATDETRQVVEAWFAQYECSDIAIKQRRRALFNRPDDIFFPLPPLKVYSPISPIETEQAWAIEQSFMNGQIESTPEQVHRGERYVFRLDLPDEEGILELKRECDGIWREHRAIRRDGSAYPEHELPLEWWEARSELDGHIL